MKTDRVTNATESNVGETYTIRQVRRLIIQNIMAYNNIMPFTYWKKKPTAILMCNTGLGERPYLQRLMEVARDVEKDKVKKLN